MSSKRNLDIHGHERASTERRETDNHRHRENKANDITKQEKKKRKRRRSHREGDPHLSYRRSLRLHRWPFTSPSYFPTFNIMASPVKYTPPPSPPSPAASFYDFSDDDEDEYSTIAHARSGRGVKLLYSKSKVAMPCPPFPLPFRADRRSRSTFIPLPPPKTTFPASSPSSNKSQRHPPTLPCSIPLTATTPLPTFLHGCPSHLWAMPTVPT